jgi:RNase H-fold protein (predicted Holliday junction resolvase)
VLSNVVVSIEQHVEWIAVCLRHMRERSLTTVEAERVLKQSGISIEKRAKAVDRLSAVILLGSYLDSGGGA